MSPAGRSTVCMNTGFATRGYAAAVPPAGTARLGDSRSDGAKRPVSRCLLRNPPYRPLAVMYSRAFPFGVVKKFCAGTMPGGLVWFGGTLACGFFLGLLALSVRAGKSVDGIIAGDVDRFGFRVHPLRLPIGDGEPCFKRSFAPCAGGISFSSHRRIFHAPRTRESATAGVSACMALLCTLPLCHTVLLLAVTSISYAV